MTEDIVSVRSAQLFELLGAALVAVVQADAQAARSTLEFVEAVGFTQGATPPGGVAPDPALRMASFRYSKRDENNDIADFIAEVPLLSMLPVPSLQVRNATLTMSVKIDDIVRRDPAPAADPGDGPLNKPAFLDIIGRRRTELIARPAPTPSGSTQAAATSQILLEIKLQQADVPVGMARLFDLMDQAITDRRA